MARAPPQLGKPPSLHVLTARSWMPDALPGTLTDAPALFFQPFMRNLHFADKEFYHLYNRGVDKRTIFLAKEDYDRFVGYLYLVNDEKNIRPSNIFLSERKNDIFSEHRRNPIVAIGAYSLLPNHFHILAAPLVDGGVSKFMQRLQTAYTMYFNQKHQRSGSLFQGTFKARHAKSDEHLKYMFAYVQLAPAELFNQQWERASNPELATLSMRVSEYQYSSIGEYATRKFNIVAPKHLPNALAGKRDLKTAVDYWVKHKGKHTPLY
jgi:putative transposase